MSSTALYVILKLDTVQNLFITAVLISIFALLFIALTASFEFDRKEDSEKYLKSKKKIIATFLTLGFISATIAIFMPTTKDMLIIKGYESLKNTGVTLENVVEKVDSVTDAWVKRLNK
jgi:hypothetical protein